MLEKIKNTIKTKGFWAGICTALAGLIGGSLTVPDFFITLINLIGG